MSLKDCPTPKKTPYSSKAVAKSAKRLYGGKTLRVYECVCGAWHLTKVRNAKRRPQEVRLHAAPAHN